MTPQQRRNYTLYHDCISFDSTFGTNRFRLPLVLIVGVDGEGRTILLGTGLLSDERSSSYEWLLRQLLEAGYRLAPKVIFTDGDPAFPDAISSVFPTARHFLCAWHLSQNIMKAIAHPLGNLSASLLTAFSRCRKIESVAEFEREWLKVLSSPAFAPVSSYLSGLTLFKVSRGGIVHMACSFAHHETNLGIRMTLNPGKVGCNLHSRCFHWRYAINTAQREYECIPEGTSHWSDSFM